MTELERVESEIRMIDMQVERVCSRPFHSEEDDRNREILVNQLMDKRDVLFETKLELSRMA